MNFDDLLIQATCAVLIDGQIEGTAWLVSDEGHLLTAGHVLGEEEPVTQVQVQFMGDGRRPADKIEWMFYKNKEVDFAVLKLTDSINRRPLPVSLAKEVEGQFKLCGYGTRLKKGSQIIGKGQFLGPIPIGNSSNTWLFRLQTSELGQEGYSGGAVFSDEEQAVVGIQTQASQNPFGPEWDVVLAMPLCRIAPFWKPLQELASSGANEWFQDDIDQYREALAEELLNDAKKENTSLDSENYIENYLDLNAALYWGPDSSDANIEKTQSLLNILHGYKYKKIVLVLGAAGSGKTAALRRFAWTLAHDDNYSKAIPILINLKDCEQGNIEKHIIAEFNRWAASARLKNSKDLKKLFDVGNGYLLFDGLNEIRPHRRKQVVEKVNDFILDYCPDLIVMTSRPQNEGLEQLIKVNERLILQPLGESVVHDYLLEARLDHRLSELARNPTLATLIKNRLGENKATLTNQSQVFTYFVERVLKEGSHKKIGQDISPDDKLKALRGLAFDLHQRSEISISETDAFALIAEKLEISYGRAILVVKTVIAHGLMIKENETLRFSPNLMMQEYFAALELREIAKEESQLNFWQKFLEIKSNFRKLFYPNIVMDIVVLNFGQLASVSSRLAPLARDPWWTESFILLLGLLSAPSDKKVPEVTTDWLIGQLARSWNATELAFWCIEHGVKTKDEKIRERIDSVSKFLQDPKPITRQKQVKKLLASIDPQYPFPSRLCIEFLIKVAGDEDPTVARLALRKLQRFNKKNVENIATQYKLASNLDLRHGAQRMLLIIRDEIARDFPLNLLPIPGVISTEESHQSVFRVIWNKIRKYKAKLPTYWLAQYPITNSEYQEFIQEENNRKPPSHWNEGTFPEEQGNHPITNVSWYDACAYCDWLTKKTGYFVRLPTEQEWEKGARGTDGRLYPWGNENPNQKRCNFNANEQDSSASAGKNTTPVEFYAEGKSFYGCWDMAGNVEEWCLPAKQRRDVIRKLAQYFAFEKILTKRMPLRGGSFKSNAKAMRCTHRSEEVPEATESHIAFRVVISLLEKDSDQIDYLRIIKNVSLIIFASLTLVLIYYLTFRLIVWSISN